ncbi:MAG TPA: MmcQ/YjbR family DNA-binding protein [Jiangellaceae bacterium]
MATWEDVRRIALALPETGERPSHDGVAAWRVKDKLFVWERPLRRSDFEALGDAAPDGEILGARVADIGVKEALISDSPDVYFTTPHFNGYPAVLVRLDVIGVDELEELIVDAWLARAPKRVAAAYVRGAS